MQACVPAYMGYTLDLSRVKVQAVNLRNLGEFKVVGLKTKHLRVEFFSSGTVELQNCHADKTFVSNMRYDHGLSPTSYVLIVHDYSGDEFNLDLNGFKNFELSVLKSKT